MTEPRCGEGQPIKLQIQLAHYTQKYNWDCGLSCILMILPRKQRQHFARNFKQVCSEEKFGRSTWTIDLCYLLKRFQVRCVYYTVTFGVHPGHRGNSFYNDILTKDEKRVNERFEAAEQSGVLVVRASVSCMDIIGHLVHGPVIILTNAKLLNCDVCKLNKVSSELRKCLPLPVPYQGHYIVLCGYDLTVGKFFYRNPSVSDRICAMSMETLEAARKSCGTDEDVIFIYS